MSREMAPGGLDVEPRGAVEALFRQEALRYREALIAAERILFIPGVSPAAKAMKLHDVVAKALNDGEEAVG